MEEFKQKAREDSTIKEFVYNAKMGVPIIDLDGLNAQEPEKRRNTLKLLHEACVNWGCFLVSNHGVDEDLLEKLKEIVNKHYEENMKPGFYMSDMAKTIIEESPTRPSSSEVDWESSLFVRHLPASNVHELPGLTDDFRETIQDYMDQVIKLAEILLALLSENLGLKKDCLKKKFGGADGVPTVGTKVAKYPECPRPELVQGLRAHTDAGGVIFLLQDDIVPGLQFLKDGKWVDIPPTPSSKGQSLIFVNTGDQIEVITNGKYKSVIHRVLATEVGSRLSIVTFYNPAANALISPLTQLQYPNCFRFQDYLNLYSTTKFSDKEPRFQEMKKRAAALCEDSVVV